MSEYLPVIIGASLYTMIILIISVFMILVLYAMAVSKSKDQEDLNKKFMPFMMLIMTQYLILMMLPAFVGSNFVEFISMIPVFSAFLAPPLIILNEISTTYIILSFVLLIASLVLSIMWMNKSYKANMLGYSMQKSKKTDKIKN